MSTPIDLDSVELIVNKAAILRSKGTYSETQSDAEGMVKKAHKAELAEKNPDQARIARIKKMGDLLRIELSTAVNSEISATSADPQSPQSPKRGP
jgi:hypothetical protein